MVYVDDFYKHHASRFGRMRMSHMTADSLGELLAMADAIGIARRHLQRDHFDVCMSKRALAIKAGAMVVSVQDIARIRHRCR